jgi:hypothetical protein
MENIYICVGAKISVFSKILKFFTAEEIDKIGIIFEENREEKIIEATPNGYNIVPIDKWKLKNKILARIKIIKVDLSDSISNTINQKNNKNKFLCFIKTKFKYTFVNSRKKIETEMVIKILQGSGVGKKIKKQCNTPQKLYSFIMDNFYCTITKVKSKSVKK